MKVQHNIANNKLLHFIERCVFWRANGCFPQRFLSEITFLGIAIFFSISKKMEKGPKINQTYTKKEKGIKAL